jgi:hypothetical protein
VSEPLRIPYIMAAEMGSFALAAMRDQMKETVERETGQPHVWRTCINMDAIELVPEDGQ